MKVVFHPDFYQVYTSDPAAAKGRMEAVVKVIDPFAGFVTAEMADHNDVAAVHTEAHIDEVRRQRLYPVAMLAAGGAVQAAQIGLAEPCFALVRPPGHHASADASWGFCYFNNMAVAIASLKNRGRIDSAYVLDIDLHYGDGTVNILGDKSYVTVHNVDAMRRDAYLREVADAMDRCEADIIGISAGFDNHMEDWGGVLSTGDYFEIGKMAAGAARRNSGGCFAVLEGGYNHDVLGQNVLALIQGMAA
ncbi:acetylpolyamine aminohydrolase [Desulfosudis oleivorans]|uniref:Histone deacetylase superfamily n=1 Tax=Desulfosudis oleivorans (strain DSM 6200 / JCM 39069 / Hxd3) TaxID=96561 RepID=A8ZWP9_DESOH|nr:acetylpolyamine aminohydrolase [Desulfosudis oleivorans]ABW68380.1 histone deacetylase superfamily [Desulfosudis oleivorans Hxd3]